ncbi:hypothetical protein EFB08_11600 [Rufibacter latericius]|uniref:Uncharacterized protein n=1 Tax=Rufibacter latericius TaxID=2487040 RepID=A0A3M9MLV1_9BACT|nr:hypothetical protein EFB08_11600 [Rufibacter latericius]
MGRVLSFFLPIPFTSNVIAPEHVLTSFKLGISIPLQDSFLEDGSGPTSRGIDGTAFVADSLGLKMS